MLIQLLAAAAITACPADPAQMKAAQSGVIASSNLSREQLLEKHFKALGGYERLRSQTSLVFSGKSVDSDGTVTMTGYRATGNKMRYEITKEDGQKFVKVFDGKQGWVDNGSEVTEVPADKLGGMRAKAEFDDALLDWKAKGHQVEVLGLSTVRGAPAYKIQLTLANCEVELRWIDKKSFLETQRTMRIEYGGETMNKTIRFGDYKKVGGLMINHTIDFEADGAKGKTIIEKMTVNEELDPKLFTKPEDISG